MGRAIRTGLVLSTLSRPPSPDLPLKFKSEISPRACRAVNRGASHATPGMSTITPLPPDAVCKPNSIGAVTSRTIRVLSGWTPIRTSVTLGIATEGIGTAAICRCSKESAEIAGFTDVAAAKKYTAAADR
ncbi:MAG: hypothetical protein O3A84_04860, partial [Proteobacteria bacterium]|nr:hypothetical protein [Pseudomonadota bacterium]